MKELFEQILHYGTFLYDFECTSYLGFAVRVRVAELDGKKYFVLQCNGDVYDLLEI